MRVVLKAGRDHAVRQGHPWIYSGAINAIEGEAERGAVAEIRGADGRVLGQGMWNDRTSIAVRMLTRGTEPIDDAFIARRIADACRLRDAALRDTDAWRVVNGEGDLLPGVVVDRYAEFVICQFLTAGADRLKTSVVRALEAQLAPRGIYERSEGNVRTAEGLARTTGILAG